MSRQPLQAPPVGPSIRLNTKKREKRKKKCQTTKRVSGNSYGRQKFSLDPSPNIGRFNYRGGKLSLNEFFFIRGSPVQGGCPIEGVPVQGISSSGVLQFRRYSNSGDFQFRGFPIWGVSIRGISSSGEVLVRGEGFPLSHYFIYPNLTMQFQLSDSI